MGKNLPTAPEAVRTVLEYDEDYTVTKMVSQVGKGPKPHSHIHKQVIYILNGHGVFELGSEHLEVKAGDHIAIGSNVPHTFFYVESEITWLEFFTPGREDLKK